MHVCVFGGLWVEFRHLQRTNYVMVSGTESVRESGSVRTKKSDKSSNMQNLAKFIYF